MIVSSSSTTSSINTKAPYHRHIGHERLVISFQPSCIGFEQYRLHLPPPHVLHTQQLHFLSSSISPKSHSESLIATHDHEPFASHLDLRQGADLSLRY